VRVGEAAVREVAAFLLDHDHFSSVPHTVLVKVGLPGKPLGKIPQLLSFTQRAPDWQ
jgi:hypothetical protein